MAAASGLLLLALAPLVAGALIGLPFALSKPLAVERLVGLLVSGGLAVLAVDRLRRLADRWVAGVLLGMSAAAFLHALWVVSASGPTPFRGPVGDSLNFVFAPIAGRTTLIDPVEVTNSRFMWGISNLNLVPLLLGAAVLGARPSRPVAAGTIVLLLLNAAMLLGTGQRGALAGLAAGLWVMSLAWWQRRWLLLVAPLAALVVVGVAFLLDKGLDLSSTQGRLAYWADVLRLMVEYPFTGSGLGLDTAHRVNVAHEINPDPARVFYAHNTFVQTLQEQGPLGLVGMLAIAVLPFAAAPLALRHPASSRPRRALLAGSLGLLAALQVHGLTDQVVPTVVGLLLVLLATAAVLASLGAEEARLLGAWSRKVAYAVGGALIVGLVIMVATPAGRTQVLLNAGSLQLNGALLDTGQVGPNRLALAGAERTLELALTADGNHPAVLRNLARARLARFDTTGALDALQQAAASNRLDAFDYLQIAHLYRDLGFAPEAYAWAARAYDSWGRTPPAPVMQPYREATVQDDFRVRDLAAQGEGAIAARNYAEALLAFQQALAFAPDNVYLRDRLLDAERGFARQVEARTGS